jgi:hypothetical protein
MPDFAEQHRGSRRTSLCCTAIARWRSSIDAIQWTVRDFVLIQSLWGRGKHIHLARWSLRG